MKIFKFDTLDSTNEYLKENNTKYEEYDVILARNQTKAKARNGNHWISSEGMALFTFYINKNFNDSIALKVPIISGLAVINALNKIEKEQYMFKWTNDVYLDNKKIAGILIENINGKLYIGIGINVNNIICDELKYIAISLKDKKHKEYDIDKIVLTIIEEFKILLDKTLNNSFLEIIESINKINYLKDSKVIIKIFNNLIKAKVISIDENGFLEIISNDEVKKISVGEIFKERILVNLDNEKAKENIINLQNKYYDVIGYTKLKSTHAKEVAKETKIKIYQIKDEKELELLKEQYKC